MRFLALADDTTGALEMGAQFAGAGLRALVTLEPSLDPAPEALVIDTHTRHRPAAEAYGCVLRLAQAARQVPHIYKKTDSTLRGNIPAEFDALRAAFPGRALVYIPAYPALGRTVTNGVLHVDGRPRGSILELLGGAATLATPATLAEAIRPGAVVVCDGACEADLEAAATALRGAVCPSIPAGPAAFAAHWPQAATVRRSLSPPRPVSRCLVINGSQQSISRQQVLQFDPPPNWTILSTPDAPAGSPESIAAEIAARAAQHAADCLIIFGGDTARAVLDAMHVTSVEPHGELLPGVPLSVFRGITLITKAGAFGPPNVLTAIRQYLQT